MTFSLPQRAMWLWQIRFGAVFALLAGTCACFTGLTGWLWIPCGVIIAVAAFCEFFYIPRLIKSYVVAAEGGAISVSHGVFVKFTYIMPYPKLVFSQTVASPVARLCGLCAVTLKAARSVALIPEMDKNDAKRLLAFISEAKDEC